MKNQCSLITFDSPFPSWQQSKDLVSSILHKNCNSQKNWRCATWSLRWFPAWMKTLPEIFVFECISVKTAKNFYFFWPLLEYFHFLLMLVAFSQFSLVIVCIFSLAFNITIYAHKAHPLPCVDNISCNNFQFPQREVGCFLKTKPLYFCAFTHIFGDCTEFTSWLLKETRMYAQKERLSSVTFSPI